MIGLVWLMNDFSYVISSKMQHYYYCSTPVQYHYYFCHVVLESMLCACDWLEVRMVVQHMDEKCDEELFYDILLERSII